MDTDLLQEVKDYSKVEMKMPWSNVEIVVERIKRKEKVLEEDIFSAYNIDVVFTVGVDYDRPCPEEEEALPTRALSSVYIFYSLIILTIIIIFRTKNNIKNKV